MHVKPFHRQWDLSYVWLILRTLDFSVLNQAHKNKLKVEKSQLQIKYPLSLRLFEYQ